MTRSSDSSDIIHASCVALNGHGALIIGPSGSGKSGLALQLIAMGAGLVADDRTCLSARQDQLIASAPLTIRGQIEARYVGILACPSVGPTPVRYVVDLGQTETERLPETREITMLGIQLPLIRGHSTPHFSAALHLYLAGTRLA